MTTLIWHERQYTAANGVRGMIRVTAGGFIFYCRTKPEAVRWLCSHSLRKGKARALVESEIRDNCGIVVA